jgi:quinol monooxygenase YgiN
MMHQIVTFEVKREGIEAARTAVATYADEVTRKEGGTAFFHAYQESEKPSRFVLVMGFRVASAVQYHEGTAWAKKLREALAPLLLAPMESRALTALSG